MEKKKIIRKVLRESIKIERKLEHGVFEEERRYIEEAYEILQELISFLRGLLYRK